LNPSLMMSSILIFIFSIFSLLVATNFILKLNWISRACRILIYSTFILKLGTFKVCII
jgi:hypothetical protein